MAIGLLGCTGTSPSGAPSTAPTATRTAIAESHRPTSTPALPAGWQPFEVASAGLRMAIPAGWSELDLGEFSRQLTEGLESSAMPEDVALAWQWLLGQVEGGQIVAVMTGPAPGSAATASIIVFLMDAPIDLRTGAMDAFDAAPALADVVVAEDQHVLLPIGDAILITTEAKGSLGVPSQSVNYFLLAADGRLLWINAAAPLEDSRFQGLMATVAEHLAYR
jgi:hypothetical protein